MVDELKKDERLHELHADLCKMLGNPKRLRIIEELRGGEKTVTELTDSLDINQSNVSQHLTKLKKRRIVDSRRSGSNVFYSISNRKIVEACELIKEVLFEQISKETELIE